MEKHAQAIIHGSGRSDWRTPQRLFDKLGEHFPLHIDLAADGDNALLAAYLGPDQVYAEHRDALTTDWMKYAEYAGVPPYGFLNPPYSKEEIAALRKWWNNGQEAGGEEELARYEAQLRALRIEAWAEKAYEESLQGFTTIGVFPYAPQTEWFRECVMGHAPDDPQKRFHAALDFWRLPHRVSYDPPPQLAGSKAHNAGVNTCIIQWGPNPGFVGPWVPSGRYWSYR
jgi:hypothetical protein